MESFFKTARNSRLEIKVLQDLTITRISELWSTNCCSAKLQNNGLYSNVWLTHAAYYRFLSPKNASTTFEASVRARDRVQPSHYGRSSCRVSHQTVLFLRSCVTFTRPSTLLICTVVMVLPIWHSGTVRPIKGTWRLSFSRRSGQFSNQIEHFSRPTGHSSKLAWDFLNWSELFQIEMSFRQIELQTH